MILTPESTPIRSLGPFLTEPKQQAQILPHGNQPTTPAPETPPEASPRSRHSLQEVQEIIEGMQTRHQYLSKAHAAIYGLGPQMDSYHKLYMDAIQRFITWNQTRMLEAKAAGRTFVTGPIDILPETWRPPSKPYAASELPTAICRRTPPPALNTNLIWDTLQRPQNLKVFPTFILDPTTRFSLVKRIKFNDDSSDSNTSGSAPDTSRESTPEQTEDASASHVRNPAVAASATSADSGPSPSSFEQAGGNVLALAEGPAAMSADFGRAPSTGKNDLAPEEGPAAPATSADSAPALAPANSGPVHPSSNSGPAIKRTQQLTISQVDETLQVVEQIRDELNKQEEPQVRKSPQGLSNLQQTDLRKFLWLHCAVLLGWSSKVKKFPRPATKGKKSEWGHPLRSLSTQDSNPYIHEAATPQQITIIKKMMHQAGIRRFAPNFMEPPNSNNNKFLWDLAIDVFVELIECGEYANVDVYLQQRNIVASELRKYVRETLARKYKKENLWNQDKQTSHTNAQKCKGRQSYLAEARLGTAAQIRGLECLYPVIKAATSEDETDFEDAPLKNRKRGHKHCKVLAVPWRSSKITQVFIRLDKISAYQKEANFIKPSGPPPRIRRQLEHAAPGSVKSSARLPKNCYSSRWLEKLSTKQHQNIQPGPPCDLKKIMQQMPAVPRS
ncbi:hypothetical protein PtB15_7B373 [Puccinia triticina]|nr:hypothetical protein PtB15_7B373 [Puccinia triticina]